MARTYGDRRQAVNPARHIATTLKGHTMKLDKTSASQPAENTKRKRPSLKVKNIAERSGKVIIEADGWHILTGVWNFLRPINTRPAWLAFFLYVQLKGKKSDGKSTQYRGGRSISQDHENRTGVRTTTFKSPIQRFPNVTYENTKSYR